MVNMDIRQHNELIYSEEMRKSGYKFHTKFIGICLGILILFSAIPYGYGKEKKEAELIIRTINVHQGAADYSLRLHGIAREFHHDYPRQIGLIGMQELARGKMTDCPSGEVYDNGASCLAAELMSLYGQKAEARISEKTWLRKMQESLGVIVGDEWRIIGAKSWNIGNNRTLLEVYLGHKTKGYKLRFYDTHFSSNKPVKWYQKLWYGYKSSQDQGEKRRSKQASKVIEIVRERAKPGELPPVVVGDFNAGRNFVTGEAEESVQKMERYFWRPLDRFRKSCSAHIVIDNVYIGKKESFPGSSGYLKLIKWHRIDIRKKPVTVNGHRIKELTDHNAEGFSFDILSNGDKAIQRINQ
jgi:hypothetical protein